jgi:hypothetical protein
MEKSSATFCYKIKTYHGRNMKETAFWHPDAKFVHMSLTLLGKQTDALRWTHINVKDLYIVKQT